MNFFSIKIRLLFSVISLSSFNLVDAQVADKGLSPPANTYQSYQGGSIARDSELSQPLDLLNDFYPAIEVLITDSSNVRRRPDVEEDDLKFTVKPSLAYKTNLGRHQFYAAYNGTYVFHQELDQEDAESNSLTASLGLDLTRRWDLNLFGNYVQGFEERGVSGSREFDSFSQETFNVGPEKISFINYGGDLIFGRKIGILVAVLGYEHSESSFDNDSEFLFEGQNSRDRETDSVHFDVSLKLASRTSVFLRAERRETDYDDSFANLDSDQSDFLVGLRFAATNRLNGVVSVGRTDKDFSDPSRQRYDDDAYYANLNYNVSPFSVVSLNASRTIEEPSAVDSSFYESEFLGVSWRHSLRSNLMFDAYAKLVDDDYDIARQDQYIDWGLGLDYVWRDWMTAGIYYGEIERNSTLNNADYDENYFGIRLRSDLRSFLKGRRRSDVTDPWSFGKPAKTQKAQ